MKKKLFTVLSSAALLATLAGSAMAATSFTDVPVSSPYAGDIESLVQAHVISGVGGGKFDPLGPLTRAQFATMMVKALNLQLSNNPSKFSDVKGHWAAAYIQTAYESGLVSGTSDTTFAPDAPVKREEAAVMVWNYLKKHGFTSGSSVITENSGTDEWAQEAVRSIIFNAMYGPEVTEKDGVYNYHSQNVMNRQEAAALLNSFWQYHMINGQETPQSVGSARGNGVGSVAKQGNIYNPTSDTTTNLAKNSDGTYSPGNFFLDPRNQNGISASDFDYNSRLFTLIKFTFDGQNVTVTVPDTGKSGLTWNVGGRSIVNGKESRSFTPDFNGNGPKTLTFQNVTNVGIGLDEGPKDRGEMGLVYQNGQWVAKYPTFN